MRRNFIFSILFLFLAHAAAWANEKTSLSFSSESRVLIVAPHPDDESLAAAGVIQSAVEAKAAVRIVYLTHGDDNELSSLVYLKKPLILRKSDRIHSGQIRKKEAVRATAALGLSPEDLIFLGYPDSGTLRIWKRHWGEAKSFRSFLTRIDKVPYEEDFSYGSDYKGENISHDLKKILLDFRPTHLFTTAPFDFHPDHQAAYLFASLAVLELKDGIPPPRVLCYLIHASRWPWPRKFLAGSPFDPPPAFSDGTVFWSRFPVSDRQAAAKELAVRRYKSQMAYGRNFLLSFVRSNELFAEVTEWPVEEAREENAFRDEGRKIDYKIVGKEFWVRAQLPDPPDERGGFGLELFGYRNDVSFSSMPKLAIWLFGKRLIANDGARRLPPSSVFYRLEKGSILLRVPLGLLKHPEKLFVAVHSSHDSHSPDVGSWRILRLPAAAFSE